VSDTLTIILGVCAGAGIGWVNMLALKKMIQMILNEGANNAVRLLVLGGAVFIMFALLFLGALISAAFLIATAAGWTLAMAVSVIRSKLTAK
jgi:hypothetical protein